MTDLKEAMSDLKESVEDRWSCVLSAEKSKLILDHIHALQLEVDRLQRKLDFWKSSFVTAALSNYTAIQTKKRLAELESENE
jgi:hypothetical protein